MAYSPEPVDPTDSLMECVECGHVQPVHYVTQLVCWECKGTTFTVPGGV